MKTRLNMDDISRVAYRPAEAARAAGMSVPTIYAWMRRENFPVIYIGGCTLILVAKFEQWLISQSADSTSIKD